MENFGRAVAQLFGQSDWYKLANHIFNRNPLVFAVGAVCSPPALALVVEFILTRHGAEVHHPLLPGSAGYRGALLIGA